MDLLPKHSDKQISHLSNSFIAAGVAIGDFNGDNLSDIFFSRQKDGGRLFQNLGGFKFKDVTYKGECQMKLL